jgi:hypothetical protein
VSVAVRLPALVEIESVQNYFLQLFSVTLGQKYEFLAKIFLLQKSIFIVVFERNSLVFNVFVEITINNTQSRHILIYEVWNFRLKNQP